MDLGPVLRVRRRLIAAGVATREMTQEELDDRAGHLIRAVQSIDRALRPTLFADGRGGEHSTGDLLRRLADVADAAQPPED